jgi:hypothetical protein
MAKASYDEVVNQLKRGNVTCEEIDRLLSGLGFAVSRRANGNHHTYIHPGLGDFFGSNYDCGHGRNPVPKPSYFRNILKVLAKYESELREMNDGTNS